MKCAQFIDPFLAAGEKGLPNPDLFDLVSSALRIHTIRVDIGNCGHRPRCGICSTERSANKLASARSATNSSLTTTTWFQTIGIQREWVERGETTILTISRQYIGGVTTRRDQREWTADGPSSRQAARLTVAALFCVPDVCPSSNVEPLF